VSPAMSCGGFGCAASLIGAAAKQAASALPAMNRARLEEVTGYAPKRRCLADCVQAPRLGREWPFCAAPATARCPGVEGPDKGRIVTARRTRQSHVRIVRSAAALGRNPVDVLIRVLDVTGFA